MKLTLSLGLLIFLANSIARDPIDITRKQRLDVAALHFEAGCEFEALRICSVLSDPARNECFHDAETACPTMAKRFKAFLSNGKDK